MVSNYRALMAERKIAAPLLSGLVARLPNAMLGLGISLAVVHNTGSYALAGICTAAFILPLTLTSPLWSRAADKWPPGRILILTGVGQSLAVGALALIAVLSARPPWLIGAGIVIGVLPPPTTSVLRAMWSRTLDDEGARSAAFSLESIFTDLAYVVGPASVAGLIAIGSPPVALVVTAVATLVGNITLARTTRVRKVQGGALLGHWLGALRWRRVLLVLPVGFFLMGSLTATELSLVASTNGSGRAGLLVAVLSIGGVLGGLAWGRRSRNPRKTRDLTLLLTGVSVGWALLAVVSSPVLMLSVLLLTGFVLSPAIISHYNLMHEIAPRQSLTESFGWLSAAGSVGAGAGSLSAGFVVAQMPRAGFLVAAAMSVLACLYVFLVVRARIGLFAKLILPR
jgi:MFS family permease